jgi:hypothetical protein
MSDPIRVRLQPVVNELRRQSRFGLPPRSSKLDEWAAIIDAALAEVDELRTALEESVKLQSHYAELLNMHDGGRRIGFANADAWIARLRVTGTLPARPS